MAGCLRNVLALVGCVTVLVIGAIVTWEYREPIGRIVGSVATSGSPAGAGPAAPRAVGTPSPRALQAAEQKELAIARRDGPAYVTLTAEEMASLVESRLDPAARAALDSIVVTLDDDRFMLEGAIRIDLFSRDLLGPFAEMLGSRQPIRVAGPGSVRAPGQLAWGVDEFVIRSFPFPQSAIPRLADKLTGRSDGAFIIRVPETVGDVRVRRDGVTFYREAR